MSRYTLWFRRQIEVCTDPQHRCYDGVWFSSELVWSAWSEICTYSSFDTARDAADTFKSINRKWQYAIHPEGVKP